MSQVHRFHDSVALFIGTGATGYFTAKEARQIARALNSCAKSVERERFSASTFGSVDLPNGSDAYGQKFKRGSK
jgi:hypothetical protein